MEKLLKTIKTYVLIAILLLVLIPLHGSITFSQEDNCSVKLVQAENDYQAGNFTAALDLIKPCLKSNDLTEAEKVKVYRLFALVYIAEELEKDANEAVKNLLIMVPNYKSDPAKDPPQLQKIVEEIARTLNPEITAITPDNANEGEKGFTMTITGKNFVYGSLLRFNGEDKKTEFIDSNELKASITADELKDNGEYDLVVYSPISNGKLSNVKKFMVNSTGSFPWTWVAVGAGAVAAGVVAVLTLGGKTSESAPPPATPIADPPGRP